jgi:hypothetical protein
LTGDTLGIVGLLLLLLLLLSLQHELLLLQPQLLLLLFELKFLTLKSLLHRLHTLLTVDRL